LRFHQSYGRAVSTAKRVQQTGPGRPSIELMTSEFDHYCSDLVSHGMSDKLGSLEKATVTHLVESAESKCEFKSAELGASRENKFLLLQ
jgi:hypothetical protein